MIEPAGSPENAEVASLPRERGGGRVLPDSRAPAGRGVAWDRYFSRGGSDPLDEAAWEKRTARIQGEKGEVIFEQEDVEVPVSWSQLALNVVASKYLYGPQGTPAREHSVRQLIERVAGTVADWGVRGGVLVAVWVGEAVAVAVGVTVGVAVAVAVAVGAVVAAGVRVGVADGSMVDVSGAGARPVGSAG